MQIVFGGSTLVVGFGFLPQNFGIMFYLEVEIVRKLQPRDKGVKVQRMRRMQRGANGACLIFFHPLHQPSHPLNLCTNVPPGETFTTRCFKLWYY